MNDKKICLTVWGASGFIGHEICKYFAKQRQKEFQVTAVKRKSSIDTKGQFGVVDMDSPELDQVLSATDVVLNLSGANIVDKAWSESRKKELWDSRVLVTRDIKKKWVEALISEKNERDKKVVLINASAVGYYNHEGQEEIPDEEKIITEASEKGSGYLSDLTEAWEKEAQFSPEEEESLVAKKIQARSIQLRFGLVLGKGGGALPKILKATRWFMGAVVGSGKQIVSWISVYEVPKIVNFIITHPDLFGPINVTAPQTIDFNYFAREIGRHTKRPVMVKVPSFLVKKTLGARADLLLKGDRVYPEKLIGAGYDFEYPNLPMALERILEKNTN